jgi:hypothetical protein
VFGRKLQCELVRKVDNREECHWPHACSREAEQVREPGILECKILPNAHRAVNLLVARASASILEAIATATTVIATTSIAAAVNTR